MNNKFIAVFFALLSTLFIFETHAYDIISDKTYVTPGCEGAVIYSKIESWYSPPSAELMASHPDPDPNSDIVLKLEQEMLKHINSVQGSGDSAGAKVHSVDGKMKSNIFLNSEHSNYLCNDDNKIRQFKVYTKISTHDHFIMDNERIFNLKPKERIRDTNSLSFNKFYDAPGSYKIYASTTISINGSSTANDIGTVTVK